MVEFGIIIILIIAILLATRQIYLRHKNGSSCCGTHEAAVQRVTVADKNKSHYPHQIDLQIEGMTCENCARRVENALNTLDGTWAKVSISNHKAHVLLKNLPDEALLARTVGDAGYVVTGFEMSAS